jgi:hypothetical protein
MYLETSATLPTSTRCKHQRSGSTLTVNHSEGLNSVANNIITLTLENGEYILRNHYAFTWDTCISNELLTFSPYKILQQNCFIQSYAWRSSCICLICINNKNTIDNFWKCATPTFSYCVTDDMKLSTTGVTHYISTCCVNLSCFLSQFVTWKKLIPLCGRKNIKKICNTNTKKVLLQALSTSI